MLFKTQSGALLAIAVLFGSCQSHAESSSANLMNATTSHFNKVMIVFYENQGYSAAMAQPFFKSLSERGALLTNFYAEAHPSQANYIAMVSGGMHGVTGDANYDLDKNHIGDLLEAKGKTWKNYAEGYPGNCFQGATKGRYVRKHVPFISFKNIQSNPARCAKIVPATQLALDVTNGTLPDFSFYSPDLDNDGHDTGIAFADKALRKTFEPLINNPAFMDGMLLIITFDEDDRHEGNKIYSVLIGKGVKPGSTDGTLNNHYGLLRTIENEFGLGTLQQNDERAVPIHGIWNQ